MNKEFKPLLPQHLQDKIINLLPDVWRKRLKTLPPQKQHHIMVVGGGLVVFVFLWLLMSIFTAGPNISLDKTKPKPAPQGIKTAISEPQPAFPQNPKDMFIPPVKKPADAGPDIVVQLTAPQKQQLDRLRENVNHTYKNVLTFTLTEGKMVAFAQAAATIDKINTKWDTSIASAATDNLAMDYLVSATSENQLALQKTSGISESEYNEIYALSARDAHFNEIANAYKKLVAEGIWGPLSSTNVSPHNPEAQQGLFPVAPPSEEEPKPAQASTPEVNPAAPAATGTAPEPAGSPEPPYSPPASH